MAASPPSSPPVPHAAASPAAAAAVTPSTAVVAAVPVPVPVPVPVDGTFRVVSKLGYTLALNRYVLWPPAASAPAAATASSTDGSSTGTSSRAATAATGAALPPRTVLFLSHANGFCKEVWEPVLAELQPLLLARHNNKGSDEDPLGLGAHGLVCWSWDLHCHGASDTIPPPADPGIGSYRWHAHAADLGAALDFAVQYETQRQQQCAVSAADAHRALRLVGAGHSMGGTNLVGLQLARPGAFHTLVLLEPVLPPLQVARAQSDTVRNPLRAAALRRRAVFPDDREAVRAYFGDAKRFGSWDARALDAYVRGGFRRVPVPATTAATTHGQADAKGTTTYALALACPPAAEAEFYATGSLHGMYFDLPALVCHGLLFLVTAHDSDMYTDAFHRQMVAQLAHAGVSAAYRDPAGATAAKGLTYRRWAAREPSGGHLLVQTRPARVAQLLVHALYHASESAATALHDPAVVDVFPAPSPMAALAAAAAVHDLDARLRGRGLATTSSLASPSAALPIEAVAFAAPRRSLQPGRLPAVSSAAATTATHTHSLRAKL